MKHISLILALCLILGIFAGCGNSQSPETTTAAPETTAPVETIPATTEPTIPPTTLPEPEVIDFDLELPQGFKATRADEDYFVYSSPNAPRDVSSISVGIQRMDESALTTTAEEFDAIHQITPKETEESQETEPTEETSEPTQPEPTKFKLLDYRNVTVDGWPAVLAEYNLVYDDYTCHIYRYEVVVNYRNYIFTFTDATDSNQWLESFSHCAGTIDLVLNTDGIELDYSGLTRYDLDCGLGLYAEDGLEPQKASGFTACLGDRNVILLFMSDGKEENNLTGMSLSEYAELLCQTNELDSFRADSYGNLLTTFYSSDENGLEYYNMITVKESADAFWVCQMACLSEDQAAYAREFSLWASSITTVE